MGGMGGIGMSGRTRTRSSAWPGSQRLSVSDPASAISGFGEASATQLKGEIEPNRLDLEPAGAAGRLGGHGPGCKAAKLEKHSGPSKQEAGTRKLQIKSTPSTLRRCCSDGWHQRGPCSACSGWFDLWSALSAAARDGSELPFDSSFPAWCVWWVHSPLPMLMEVESQQSDFSDLRNGATLVSFPLESLGCVGPAASRVFHASITPTTSIDGPK